MMSVLKGLTVDLEDWYHGLTSTNKQPSLWPTLEKRVVANTERLLDFLEATNVRATFFVLGKVAEQYPDLIRCVAGAGHEIGVHGYAHQDVRGLTPDSFAAEIDRALDCLTPLVSGPLIGHRAPYFSINDRSLWALDLLAERGFRYDSSFFPARNSLYGYPRAPRFPHRLGENQGMMEFPVSTARLFGMNLPIAGGIYLRALPYWFIKWSINRLHREGQPAIIYLHPYDLDTEQSVPVATPREWFVRYCNRRGSLEKLRRLLRDFSFAPLRELIEVVMPAQPKFSDEHAVPYTRPSVPSAS
jgi:polysaccharide deacetylase family protein (PEP-CTERM system associated)